MDIHKDCYSAIDLTQQDGPHRRETDKQRHLVDNRLFKPYNGLKAKYGEYSRYNEADFSERLLIASDHVIGEYQKQFGAENAVDLSNDSITNLIYQVDLRALREDVSSYLKFKKDSYVLFDNLDRGWPEDGLTSDDILVMRCLIDASRKIQREMRALGLRFSCLVFLRNDVYQLLMERTSDFGKDLRAQLDWTDADQMREMLRLRLIQDEDDKSVSFETVWRKICISHIHAEESSQYLIDRSLYRPRNVLKILYHCRAVALNLGKTRIDEEDIMKGLSSFSNDLVVEADRELSDVMPGSAKKIYSFVGERPSFSLEELEILLDDSNWKNGEFSKLVERLVYFSILGIERNDEVRFIYDVGYDMNIIRAEIAKFSGTIRYRLHPAFWPALKIRA
jgi:hypothetical protein